MFKNRAVQVKMVKTNGDDEIIETPQESNSQIIAVAADATKGIMREGLKIVAVYVALDTTRRLILELAKK